MPGWARGRRPLLALVILRSVLYRKKRETGRARHKGEQALRSAPQSGANHAPIRLLSRPPPSKKNAKKKLKNTGCPTVTRAAPSPTAIAPQKQQQQQKAHQTSNHDRPRRRVATRDRTPAVPHGGRIRNTAPRTPSSAAPPGDPRPRRPATPPAARAPRTVCLPAAASTPPFATGGAAGFLVVRERGGQQRRRGVVRRGGGKPRRPLRWRLLLAAPGSDVQGLGGGSVAAGRLPFSPLTLR